MVYTGVTARGEIVDPLPDIAADDLAAVVAVLGTGATLGSPR